MKKENFKKNLIVLLIYTIFFLCIYFLLTRNNYIYGSTTDFQNQHYFIPEYFRTLFYKTRDLLPDFGLNLGGGANIYYLSYYGLLSPIILISYMFPHVSMLTYIIIASSVISIISGFLMYKYLKSRKFSGKLSFVGGLLLMCASPIIFHSHRHIMFVNYIPFVILGMFGVDKYFEKKNGTLLIISCALMIFTSYYYSVGGLIALFLFGIYRYLEKNKFKFDTFIKDMLKFCVPFITAVMMAGVLLLPTLYCLLNGRGVGNSVAISKLFIPKLDFSNILYSTYSPGLTSIVVVGIVSFLLSKKKNEKFLGIILALIGIFPLFNYILNGTLYIDSKSLIPFTPIIVFVVISFIDKVLKKELEVKKVLYVIVSLFGLGLIGLILSKFGIGSANYHYLIDLFIVFVIVFLCGKTRQYVILPIGAVLISICMSIGANLGDHLMTKRVNTEENNKIIENILENDDDFYRINNYALGGEGLNSIIDIRELSSTIYSSTYNKTYNRFYYDVFNNVVSFRNRSMTANSTNILFSNYFGEKYIVTGDNLELGLSYTKDGSSRIYKLDDVFPIGYATSNILNKKEYDDLKYPDKVLAIINSAVVDDESNVEPIVLDDANLELRVVSTKNASIGKTDKGYKISSGKDGRIKLELNEDMTNKVLFFRFKNDYDPPCSKGDIYIAINGSKNKLTCRSWKYHNQNFVFDYVLYNQDEFELDLAEGKYDLSEIETYIIDYDLIKNASRELDALKIDTSTSYGDNIHGEINVLDDGYFVIQIPYDKGFVINVDGEETKYENVNDGLIGFKISKGNHKIDIEYRAPYKTAGLILSGVGLVTFIIYVAIVQIKKRKKL